MEIILYKTSAMKGGSKKDPGGSGATRGEEMVLHVCAKAVHLHTHAKP